MNRCNDEMMDMIKQPNHNNGQSGSMPRTFMPAPFLPLLHSVIFSLTPLSHSPSSAIFEPEFDPIEKEAMSIMARTEDGPTEPFIPQTREHHPAPPTPAQVTAEVFPEVDLDDPAAPIEDDTPPAWRASQEPGTDCDSIMDLNKWLECEMAKHEMPSPAPPPYVPPSPPPPTIGHDPALEDCDLVADLDAWSVHTTLPCQIQCLVIVVGYGTHQELTS